MAKNLYKDINENYLKNSIKDGFIRIDENPMNLNYVIEVIKNDYLKNKEMYDTLFKRHLLYKGYRYKMNEKKNSKYLKSEVYLPNLITNTDNFYKEQISYGFLPIESLDNINREIKAVKWDKYPEINDYANNHYEELRDRIYKLLMEIVKSVKMIKFSNHLDKASSLSILVNVIEPSKFKLCKKLPRYNGIKNIIKGLLILDAVNLKLDKLDFFLGVDLRELFKFIDVKDKYSHYFIVSKYLDIKSSFKRHDYYQLGEIKKLFVSKNIKISEDLLNQYKVKIIK